ncbi:YdcF family protein [Vibrio sp. DNF-1]|nr:ElyC/SanA/YdcF family protein [Vibrio salinus]MCE0492680.1 YdcF family protein [Vibrio salinus]
MGNLSDLLVTSVRLFLLVIIGLILIDRWVSWSTQKQIIDDIDNVPHVKVAVVLGTSKYLGKTLNDYYMNRINAAIYLFHKNTADNFLLSGDNAHRSYNEPWTMKRDLLRAGVPEKQITLDYAGFSTLDSILRAKNIFVSDHFLIITQRFHCERALFIANAHHIDARCLAVSGPKNHIGLALRIREIFARVKAVLDLYVFNSEPKFLGPVEPIEPAQPVIPKDSIAPTKPEESVIIQTNK